MVLLPQFFFHFLQYHRPVVLVCTRVPYPLLPKQTVPKEKTATSFHSNHFNTAYVKHSSLHRQDSLSKALYFNVAFFLLKTAKTSSLNSHDAAGTLVTHGSSITHQKIRNVSSVVLWNMTPNWSRTHGFKERRNTSGAGKSGRRPAAHRPYRSDGRARGGKQGLVGPHLYTQPLWRGWDDEMSKGMCGMTEMGWLKFTDVPPAAWLSFSRRLGGESETSR